MQVYEIQGAFGLENLVRAERPDPEPGPGQVLLEISAVSLNYRDLLMVQGKYNPRQKLPLVPCSDGAGRVVAVGQGVRRVAVGQRVMPAFLQGWIAGDPRREHLTSTLGGPLGGTLARRMVLSEEGVVPVPEHLTDVEAATLPCAALTAWSALVEEAGLRPGQVVVVQGTGGVSIFALQMAKRLGAVVIATSSSEAKLERARELGADHTVCYSSEPAWGKRVLELTAGAGADVIVEVGGGSTIEQSLLAVRPGGTVAVIGNLGGSEKNVSLVRILMRKLRLQGVLVGHRDAFEAMSRAIGHWKLRPVVDRVFPFDEARGAFEHLAAQKHLGKVCIQVGPAAGTAQ
jgi:NADPH:quinone reductase-like Zn-dependent oxidoreductase